MADYKDIIAGTINSIVGKVKEVAESGAVRDIYENGANRAKSYGRIAKLALELNGENEELKRVYTTSRPRTPRRASSRRCSRRPKRSAAASPPRRTR